MPYKQTQVEQNMWNFLSFCFGEQSECSSFRLGKINGDLFPNFEYVITHTVLDVGNSLRKNCYQYLYSDKKWENWLCIDSFTITTHRVDNKWCKTMLDLHAKSTWLVTQLNLVTTSIRTIQSESLLL